MRKDVKSYIKRCDICLALNTIKYKPYGNLKSLPILTHWWKILTRDFVTILPLSADWKSNSYDSILIIFDRLTTIVQYKTVTVTIDAPGLAKVIIDMVVRYQNLPNSIISDWEAIFISKFWSSLCYFLGIKQQLLNVFHPQIDGQTKRQNSTIEAYLRAFVNIEENDWAKFLPMAKFTYNNIKNIGIDCTLFELNCGYHPCISYKEDINSYSRSKTIEELLGELQKLISIYCENLHHIQEL